MAPTNLVDLSQYDLDKVIFNQDEIYKINPHRYEFMLLDGIIHYDPENIVLIGYRQTRDDEFWVRGHIPGRPIFPGVLMVEASAQLVSFIAGKMFPERGFMGFGGIDDVKFRGAVTPGDKVIFVGKVTEIKSRKCIADVQSYVGGKLVYEGKVTGMWI